MRQPAKFLLIGMIAALAACNSDEKAAETDSTTVAPGAPPPSGETPGAGTVPTPDMSPPTAEPGAAAQRPAERSTGQVVDDSVITTKVKSSLLADDQVKGMDISVETRNAEVTLSGQVESQAQADRAIELTKAVEGVAAVNNQMSVKPRA